MQMLLACVLVFVASVIGSGEAVTCYKCDYSSLLGNDDCKTLNMNGDLGNCTGAVCSKQKITAGDIESISRGCGDDTKKVGCSSASFAGVKTVLCYCNTDRCNGASVQTGTVVSMFAIAVFAAVLATWL